MLTLVLQCLSNVCQRSLSSASFLVKGSAFGSGSLQTLWLASYISTGRKGNETRERTRTYRLIAMLNLDTGLFELLAVTHKFFFLKRFDYEVLCAMANSSNNPVSKIENDCWHLYSDIYYVQLSTC